MPTLELLSVVAVSRDIPEHGLVRGQVGTIVEVFTPSDFEVEFVDTDGQTYAMTELRSEDLFLLHYRPVAQERMMSTAI
jgi:hypothetical protein